MKVRHRIDWKSWWRTLAVISAILFVIRAALPVGIARYLESVFRGTGDYALEIGDVDLSLWRGRYDVEGVVLREPHRPLDDPLLVTDRLEIAVAWRGLLAGRVVSRLVLHQPRLSIASAVEAQENASDEPADGEAPPDAPASEEDGQIHEGESGRWLAFLDGIAPFAIESAVIRDGELRWATLEGGTRVDLYMTDFYAEMLNLTNIQDEDPEKVLIAELEAAGRPLDTGEFEARMRFDPFAEEPRFELDAELRKLDLIALNDFFSVYGNVDVEAGTGGIYAEFVASDGRIDGYVKTLFEGLELFRYKEIESAGDLLEAFWEGLVDLGAELFENQPRDRLAARIPLAGELDQASTDLVDTIGSLLRNAFVVALRPALDESIELRDLNVAVPRSGADGNEQESEAVDP